MNGKKSVQEAFNETAYRIAGNGNRDVQVLKEALAAVENSTASDIYGTGEVIEDFQTKMANILGKETAVFFPSGTMAQQIALRIWCDEKEVKKVAYHPLCHLEIHEQDGMKELHHIEPILLADKDRLITLEDVANLKDDIACLLLELPQREIGGQLPEYTELEAISAHCRARGIKLHLDGARLFEILPYYGKSAAEISALFDSVYISFYKGIGGIAGAILAGSEDFTKQSKIWKRRHGGDLISLYPYIISSDYYFRQREGRMQQYYEGAKELAAWVNQCHDVTTLPAQPVSNMFHMHFQMSKEQIEPILSAVYEATGIGLSAGIRATGEHTSYCEISIGDKYADIPKEKLREFFLLLDKLMNESSAE
ncbi:low specificity L-threonine aldolase [Paenibacillus odorifer]|uniref:Low specificity L-threonine aldolase n=1 Tax=Paenibacillus odorifer TaxID=189426 RepID=A0A1R0X9V0_9BACL|nr:MULTISPECIES: beta-eliminating lyase-related protein [Paenibacillus]ETT47160.1 aromatic amino acid beta-eliminating lyase/threonine aldolase [Paenibacillus sp. FSL H8-237]OMD07969.1 low specificity L-threonine aldolase [Paenibacillus odorifer]OMD31571.1 low specificity L-threonine aldolase [Paenibacillus odorifer]OMD31875.1 low specificity L-threonine aldolase [Paenibacillus odorifer]OME55654.1 low specificity L-threonine aldolase [Paenibacillus odorifer]